MGIFHYVENGVLKSDPRIHRIFANEVQSKGAEISSSEVDKIEKACWKSLARGPFFILVGPGASGKNTMRERLSEKGLTSSVPYTTRPIREGEQEGIDYHFVDFEKFEMLASSGFFLEHRKFDNGHSYGTPAEDFLKHDIFIMTPSGIKELSPESRAKSLVIYLDVPEDIRLRRLEKRLGDGDDPMRRIIADRKDFSGFVDYDIKITNPDGVF